MLSLKVCHSRELSIFACSRRRGYQLASKKKNYRCNNWLSTYSTTQAVPTCYSWVEQGLSQWTKGQKKAFLLSDFVLVRQMVHTGSLKCLCVWQHYSFVLCSIHCACGCPQGVKTSLDLLDYVYEFGEHHLVLHPWMSMFLLTSLRLMADPVAKKSF